MCIAFKTGVREGDRELIVFESFELFFRLINYGNGEFRRPVSVLITKIKIKRVR